MAEKTKVIDISMSFIDAYTWMILRRRYTGVIAILQNMIGIHYQCNRWRCGFTIFERILGVICVCCLQYLPNEAVQQTQKQMVYIILIAVVFWFSVYEIIEAIIHFIFQILEVTFFHEEWKRIVHNCPYLIALLLHGVFYNRRIVLCGIVVEAEAEIFGMPSLAVAVTEEMQGKWQNCSDSK